MGEAGKRVDRQVMRCSNWHWGNRVTIPVESGRCACGAAITGGPWPARQLGLRRLEHAARGVRRAGQRPVGVRYAAPEEGCSLRTAISVLGKDGLSATRVLAHFQHDDLAWFFVLAGEQVEALCQEVRQWRQAHGIGTD